MRHLGCRVWAVRGVEGGFSRGDLDKNTRAHREGRSSREVAAVAAARSPSSASDSRVRAGATSASGVGGRSERVGRLARTGGDEGERHVGDDAPAHHGPNRVSADSCSTFSSSALARPFLPPSILSSLVHPGEVSYAMIRSALANAVRPALNAVCLPLLSAPLHSRQFSSRGPRPPSPLASPRLPRECASPPQPSIRRCASSNTTPTAAHQVRWRLHRMSRSSVHKHACSQPPVLSRLPSSPEMVLVTRLPTPSRRSSSTLTPPLSGSSTTFPACPPRARFSSSRLWRV